jgi:hypothetical protein
MHPSLLPVVGCRSAPRAASAGKRHLRKDSSVLQFDIELMEGQPRNSSSNGPLSRRSLLRLPIALAVAALVEAKDPLESSIGMQVGPGRAAAGILQALLHTCVCYILDVPATGRQPQQHSG